MVVVAVGVDVVIVVVVVCTGVVVAGVCVAAVLVVVAPPPQAVNKAKSVTMTSVKNIACLSIHILPFPQILSALFIVYLIHLRGNKPP